MVGRGGSFAKDEGNCHGWRLSKRGKPSLLQIEWSSLLATEIGSVETKEKAKVLLPEQGWSPEQAQSE